MFREDEIFRENRFVFLNFEAHEYDYAPVVKIEKNDDLEKKIDYSEKSELSRAKEGLDKYLGLDTSSPKNLKSFLVKVSNCELNEKKEKDFLRYKNSKLIPNLASQKVEWDYIKESTIDKKIYLPYENVLRDLDSKFSSCPKSVVESVKNNISDDLTRYIWKLSIDAPKWQMNDKAALNKLINGLENKLTVSAALNVKRLSLFEKVMPTLSKLNIPVEENSKLISDLVSNNRLPIDFSVFENLNTILISNPDVFTSLRENDKFKKQNTKLFEAVVKGDFQSISKIENEISNFIFLPVGGIEMIDLSQTKLGKLNESNSEMFDKDNLIKLWMDSLEKIDYEKMNQVDSLNIFVEYLESQLLKNENGEDLFNRKLELLNSRIEKNDELNSDSQKIFERIQIYAANLEKAKEEAFNNPNPLMDKNDPLRFYNGEIAKWERSIVMSQKNLMSNKRENVLNLITHSMASAYLSMDDQSISDSLLNAKNSQDIRSICSAKGIDVPAGLSKLEAMEIDIRMRKIDSDFVDKLARGGNLGGLDFSGATLRNEYAQFYQGKEDFNPVIRQKMLTEMASLDDLRLDLKDRIYEEEEYFISVISKYGDINKVPANERQYLEMRFFSFTDLLQTLNNVNINLNGTVSYFNILSQEKDEKIPYLNIENNKIKLLGKSDLATSNLISFEDWSRNIKDDGDKMSEVSKNLELLLSGNIIEVDEESVSGIDLSVVDLNEETFKILSEKIKNSRDEGLEIGEQDKMQMNSYLLFLGQLALKQENSLKTLNYSVYKNSAIDGGDLDFSSEIQKTNENLEKIYSQITLVENTLGAKNISVNILKPQVKERGSYYHERMVERELQLKNTDKIIDSKFQGFAKHMNGFSDWSMKLQSHFEMRQTDERGIKTAMTLGGLPEDFFQEGVENYTNLISFIGNARQGFESEKDRLINLRDNFDENDPIYKIMPELKKVRQNLLNKKINHLEAILENPESPFSVESLSKLEIDKTNLVNRSDKYDLDTLKQLASTAVILAVAVGVTMATSGLASMAMGGLMTSMGTVANVAVMSGISAFGSTIGSIGGMYVSDLWNLSEYGEQGAIDQAWDNFGESLLQNYVSSAGAIGLSSGLGAMATTTKFAGSRFASLRALNSGMNRFGKIGAKAFKSLKPYAAPGHNSALAKAAETMGKGALRNINLAGFKGTAGEFLKGASARFILETGEESMEELSGSTVRNMAKLSGFSDSTAAFLGSAAEMTLATANSSDGINIELSSSGINAKNAGISVNDGNFEYSGNPSEFASKLEKQFNIRPGVDYDITIDPSTGAVNLDMIGGVDGAGGAGAQLTFMPSLYVESSDNRVQFGVKSGVKTGESIVRVEENLHEGVDDEQSVVVDSDYGMYVDAYNDSLKPNGLKSLNIEKSNSNEIDSQNGSLDSGLKANEAYGFDMTEDGLGLYFAPWSMPSGIVTGEPLVKFKRIDSKIVIETEEGQKILTNELQNVEVKGFGSVKVALDKNGKVVVKTETDSVLRMYDMSLDSVTKKDLNENYTKTDIKEGLSYQLDVNDKNLITIGNDVVELIMEDNNLIIKSKDSGFSEVLKPIDKFGYKGKEMVYQKGDTVVKFSFKLSKPRNQLTVDIKQGEYQVSSFRLGKELNDIPTKASLTKGSTESHSLFDDTNLDYLGELLTEKKAKPQNRFLQPRQERIVKFEGPPIYVSFSDNKDGKTLEFVKLENEVMVYEGENTIGKLKIGDNLNVGQNGNVKMDLGENSVNIKVLENGELSIKYEYNSKSQDFRHIRVFDSETEIERFREQEYQKLNTDEGNGLNNSISSNKTEAKRVTLNESAPVVERKTTVENLDDSTKLTERTVLENVATDQNQTKVENVVNEEDQTKVENVVNDQDQTKVENVVSNVEDQAVTEKDANVKEYSARIPDVNIPKYVRNLSGRSKFESIDNRTKNISDSPVINELAINSEAPISEVTKVKLDESTAVKNVIEDVIDLKTKLESLNVDELGDYIAQYNLDNSPDLLVHQAFQVLRVVNEGVIMFDQNGKLVELKIDVNNAVDVLKSIKSLDDNIRGQSYLLRKECLRRAEGKITSDEAYTYGEIPSDKGMDAFLDNPDNWVPERVQLHETILADEFEKSVALSERLNDSSPIIYALRGNTAAGKSTSLRSNSEFAKTGDTSGAINPDVYKGYLRIEDADIDYTPTASQTHEEGSMLARRLKDMIETTKPPISEMSMIIDKRLNKGKNINELLETSDRLNRPIKLMDVEASLELSCLRVLTRAIASEDPAVPFSAITEGYEGIRQNRMALIQQVKNNPAIKEYALYVYDGEQNVLVAEKKNGEFLVHNQNLYAVALDGNIQNINNTVEKVGSTIIDDTYIQNADNYFKPYLERYKGKTLSEALDAHSKLTVEPHDGAFYMRVAMQNLSKTSRTAQGVVDTSASMDKAAKMAGDLTDAQAAIRAKTNYEKVMRGLFEEKNKVFNSPEDVRVFVESVGKDINQGIVKEGILLRSGEDSKKYPYTKVADLPLALEQFYQEFYDRINDPNQDPIELAAWVEYRVNLTDHIFADGCGKSSLALSSFILMRNNLPLPQYQSKKDTVSHSAKTIRGVDPIADQKALKSLESTMRKRMANKKY